MHAELQIRVAVTRESVLTTEFDPQIANNAALADPQTEVLMEGFVFEGVARGAVLSGQWSSSELLELRVRESRSMDIGRMQLSTRRGATVPVRVEAGKSSSPQHDTAVSWYPTPPR